MTVANRASREPRGLPWPVIVAALVVGHIGVVVIFVLGRTVSIENAFTVNAIRTLATGPIVPTLHAVAALALLAALHRPRWQDGASITTAAVWVGQCSLLITTAITRAAPVPLYAQVLVVPITVIAVATAVTWGSHTTRRGDRDFPDSITAYVAAVSTLCGAAGVAYARWNRRARRTLRAMRKALQQNREALETSVEGWAAARRIAISEGVDPKKLPRIPRKVLVLTAADDEPEALTGGAGDDPQN